MKISAKGLLVLLFVLLSFGCASTKNAFDHAKAKDSIIAYENFLSKHPNSEYSSDAKKRLSELKNIEAERSTKIKSILSSYKVGHTTFAQYKNDAKIYSWDTGNYTVNEHRLAEPGKSALEGKILGSDASITVIYAPKKYCHLKFKGEAELNNAVLTSIIFTD